MAYTSYLIMILIPIILLLASASASNNTPRPPPLPTPTSPNQPSPSPPSIIDPKLLEFKLSLLWPQGYCKTKSSGCEKPKKGTKIPEDFTIHGLVPVYRGECTASDEQFERQKLKDIESELLEHWPSLKILGQKAEKYEPFWRNEWMSHGRVCSLFTVHSYFDQTLKLFKDSKPLKALASRPNTPEGVRKVFNGREPNVLCGKSADGKVTYLKEVRFCLNGSYNYVNCPKTSSSSSCLDGQPFSYGET